MRKALLISAAMLASSTLASAATITTLASDNATMKPSGPRTGSSGKAFFNVEGDSNGANASYGVIDFSGSSIAGASGGVTSLSLTLTESNAAFSTPGSVEIYLASDSSANIQPSTSTAPNYASGQTPEGIGSTSAFGTLYDLGSLAFTTTGNVNSGQADVFTDSSLTPDEAQLIAADATNGTTLRLVLTPGTTTTSATYAGYSNTSSTTPGPVLSLTATPEPSSLGLLGLSSLAALRRRRR